ncbi:MAG: DNA adenine methylase [Bacteroidales bacterium]|nr:DNA adenine methylase [Bacteroidales bacterium]
MYQIGRILKTIREERSFQILDVQDQTGIDSSQLSRIETGKRLPTVEQLTRLSTLYRVDNSLLQIQRESDKIIGSIEDPAIGIISLDVAKEKLIYGHNYINMFMDSHLSQPIAISSRRYIGSKAKLIDWIFEKIEEQTENVHSFCDIFAGTGVVANEAVRRYDHVIINDLLYSNNVIYNAFFAAGEWDKNKLCDIITGYNAIDPTKLDDNYFSINFGGKFFERNESKRIGFIRQDIEDRKKDLTEKEYNILIATLIYNIDKIANTLGHYEAYIQKPIQPKPLYLKLIDVNCYPNVDIHRADSNQLARQVTCDVVYIDPPYNSRQYSRFYHLYETLVKWDMPILSGVAMKPPIENMSDYCSSKAAKAMKDLVCSIRARYIVVSYNNTYKSKSSSSENKITLEELENILREVGETVVFEHNHRAFNAGKTEFANHKELLFVTRVNE